MEGLKELELERAPSCAHHTTPPSIESILEEIYAFELSLKNDSPDCADHDRSAMSYLNHGSFGDPYPSTLKLRQFFTELCYRNPMVYHRSLVPVLVERSKARLCDYLSITDQCDALSFASISSSLFQVLAAVYFEPGDVIITSDTIYHSLVDAIHHIVTTNSLQWIQIETPFGCKQEQIFENFEAVVKQHVATGNTIKLLVIDHISSKPTVYYPVQRICKMCRALHIPTLVDGAHVPGALPSGTIRVEDMMATFYAFTLHKWVNVPRAAGGLWINQRDIQSFYASFIDTTRLVVQGGSNTSTTTNMYLDTSKPGYLIDHLTQGIYDESTREYENILVLPHCLDLVLASEMKFKQHASAMREYTVKTLADAWALPDATRWVNDGVVLPMVSIPLPTTKLLAAARFVDVIPKQPLKRLKQHLVMKLWTEYAIEVPIFIWKEKKLGVRISFGRQVVLEDIRRLGDAINRIINEGYSL